MPCFSKIPLTPQLKLMISVVLMVGIASCGNNRVSQCNQLIEVANRAVSEVQAATQDATPDNPSPDNVEAMRQIADAADRARADMEGLQLGDEQLRSYQERFITMYTETSRSTRELIAAAEARNPDAAQAAFSDLRAATEQETPLVEAVNNYCTN